MLLDSNYPYGECSIYINCQITLLYTKTNAILCVKHTQIKNNFLLCKICTSIFLHKISRKKKENLFSSIVIEDMDTAC